MAEVVTEAKIPDWTQWVGNFDGTYKLYADNFNALVRLRPWVQKSHPELLAKHDAMIKKFEDQRPTLLKLKETRDAVVNWLHDAGAFIQGALNFTGIQAGMDWLKERFGFHGLGFPPLVIAVGLAAATTALVVIANLVRDAFVYSQELNALQALEAKGYTPQQAASAVKSVRAPQSSLIEGITGAPTELLVLAGLAVLLGPPLINMMKERR